MNNADATGPSGSVSKMVISPGEAGFQMVRDE